MDITNKIIEEVTEVDISNKTMTFQIGRKITTVAIKNVEVAANKMVDLIRQITTGILGVIMVVDISRIMTTVGGKMLCLNILTNLATIGPMVGQVFPNREITTIQEETEVLENSRKILEIMKVAIDAFNLVILQENVQMRI